MLKSAQENVRVVCRVRPHNQKELSSINSSACVTLSQQNLDLSVNDDIYSFQFDRIFGPESNYYGVYKYTAMPLIQDIFSGYDATIFAYGQTGIY